MKSDVGGRCDIFNVGVIDCVCGCVGVVLAVNVEAVEGRNTSSVCALNRSQKRCFMIFYYVLLCIICRLDSYFCHVELSNCPFYCGIRVTQKSNVHFIIVGVWDGELRGSRLEAWMKSHKSEVAIT